jgi:hypothetical protein
MNCVIAILLTASSLTAAEAKPEFTFREISPSGLQLSDSGKPVFVYNFGMMLAKGFPQSMERSCYLHPVYAPNGVLLTDDFNRDHPHHRGISWMWQEVTVDGRKGDIWTVEKFKQRFVRWKTKETDGSVAKLAVENGWFEGDRKFVKEEVLIVTHPVEQSANGPRRVLDFTLSFEATDKPVEIVGTSEGKKGFGGFCFRLAPRDGGTDKTIIRTDKGPAPKDAVLGKFRWAEVAGLFHGTPAWGRIDDQPSNPGFPKNGWLLRHGFGFMNVSYPGLTPLVLQSGKPLVLNYRVTLGGGEAPK